VSRLAQDRAIQYEDHEVWDEITRRLRAQRDRGDFIAVHVAPTSSGDVPDESETRLVILGPEHTHASKAGDLAARALAGQILEQRGTGPRRYRNALAFLAPDRARLADLEQAVRSYKAWASIEAEREQLNLDAFQSRQAASKREEADRTVDQRMPEAYCWAMIPVQPSPSGPMDWEEVRLSGQDGLATRASRKLRSEEHLIVEFGAVRLRKELDDVPLWRGDHVGLRQLWEDFAQYLYLPRLRDSGVLIEAAQQGLSFINWEQDGFGYAEAWDEGSGRYRGLRGGESVGISMTAESVLVKPEVARRQLDQERPTPAPKEPPGEGEVAPTPGEGLDAEPESELPRRFHGGVSLDPVRLSRDVAEIADAVVQHLASQPNAEVELSLEIQAKLPEGAPDNVVRTVTENAKTLKFREYGFESE
jgi:hypothetical protein